jgi:hypothetical protein
MLNISLELNDVLYTEVYETQLISVYKNGRSLMLGCPQPFLLYRNKVHSASETLEFGRAARK